MTNAKQRPLLPVRLARYGARAARPATDRVHLAVQGLRAGPRTPPPGEGQRAIGHQWQWSACYAPLVTMYLDQFGRVRACCQNTDHLLGDIRESSLLEIWRGRAAEELRHALASGDLGLGCSFCSWQLEEGDPSSAFLRMYDEEPAGWSRSPAMPRELELSITNTCNLQCVMCNGDWSSSIRAQREHRPPLELAYPERFFAEDLPAVIPHLSKVNFTGGEPLLGQAPLRVMELLIEHGRQGLVLGIVTNATTWNARVERILDQLVPFVTVSFDGGTREVYERIRVGASFDAVLENLDRFRSIVADHGAGIGLAHCLMVDNWSTFPELLAIAEDRDLDVYVNTVRFPERHSLYHLDPSALAEVVAGLSARSPEVERTITGSRLRTWHQQLAALEGRLRGDAWPEALGVPPASTPVELTRARPSAEAEADGHADDADGPSQ